VIGFHELWVIFSLSRYFRSKDDANTFLADGAASPYKADGLMSSNFSYLF